MRVAALSQIHLVGDTHDLSQTVALQMVALLHHPAYTQEACTASRLASPQGETLEVRKDAFRQILDRPYLVLEGAISLGLADPTTAKERLQILQ